MIVIEFFGLPGTGKSTFKTKLVRNYFKNCKIYDYKSINYLNNDFFTKSYLSIIKNKKIRSLKNVFFKKKINLDLFYKKYNNFVNQKFNDTKHKTKILKIRNIINKSNFNNHEKELFWKWVKEETLANEIANKRKVSNK